MTRLRKASRFWRSPEARASARRVSVSPEGPVFSVEPEAIFGRCGPLEVEIGAGKGEFILARAAANPGCDFLAVELSSAVARRLAVRCGRAGLSNLKVIRMDARTLVNLMLPESSVSSYHIYFPDPWPKERHAKRRLITLPFVTNLCRTLKPGGAAYVATDVQSYAEWIIECFGAAGFQRLEQGAPGARDSGFGRKYVATGRRIYSAVFVRPGQVSHRPVPSKAASSGLF